MCLTLDIYAVNSRIPLADWVNVLGVNIGSAAMLDHVLVPDLAQSYHRDGYLPAVRILDEKEALAHRQALEDAEQAHGNVHYTSKMHTIFAPAARLATHPAILDVVESLLGKDIILSDSTFIIKEAQSPSHVSWHQDLTYWGFNSDQQVSLWLALSPATAESGCMRMIPGSHLTGQRAHEDLKDADNVLYRGQTITDVDETRAVMCPLQPGEASFHHGYTMHASMPNASDDRRIGFNVQYMTPAMKSLINPHESGVCVRGEDRFGHFQPDVLATRNFHPDDLARHAELDRLKKESWENA